jgi:hypothetical protein
VAVNAPTDCVTVSDNAVTSPSVDIEAAVRRPLVERPPVPIEAVTALSV